MGSYSMFCRCLLKWTSGIAVWLVSNPIGNLHWCGLESHQRSGGGSNGCSFAVTAKLAPMMLQVINRSDLPKQDNEAEKSVWKIPMAWWIELRLWFAIATLLYAFLVWGLPSLLDDKRAGKAQTVTWAWMFQLSLFLRFYCWPNGCLVSGILRTVSVACRSGKRWRIWFGFLQSGHRFGVSHQALDVGWFLPYVWWFLP